eukprot:4243692-Lingulodinium_polyedra.AAC.1
MARQHSQARSGGALRTGKAGRAHRLWAARAHGPARCLGWRKTADGAPQKRRCPVSQPHPA